ncbi:MAG: hypothetical protein KDE50_34725 [Caldilineaceae bacterium]|nr:hypothetical protein [Caldilineaceae bacterium]
MIVPSTTVMLFLHFRAVAIPLDSPEAREIMDAIQRGYDALTIAYQTGNLNILSEIFVDHPDYLKEIGPANELELRTYIAKISGPDALKSMGYLTSIKNKIRDRLQGTGLIEAASNNAKSENQELTQEELDDIAQRNHGLHSSLSVATASSPKRILEYFSIKIKGDRAWATYDEGVTGRTALLVRIDGHWYVAGIY